jgi:hypothetical protein
LRRDFVKCESRKKAQHGFRHTLRNFRVRVTFRDRGVWQAIDPTARPVELPLTVEAYQVLARYADDLNVAGPNHSVLADILHDSLNWHCSGHRINPSLFNQL